MVTIYKTVGTVILKQTMILNEYCIHVYLTLKYFKEYYMENIYPNLQKREKKIKNK